MIDTNAFVQRVRGMITDPAATMASDGRPAPPWGLVLREHALPLLVASALVFVVLSLAFPLAPAPGVDGPGGGVPDVAGALMLQALRIVMNIAMLAVMGAIVSFYAGMFGGTANFDAGFVLVVLSMTPLFVAEAVMPVPGLGLLISLAGFIYSLVILYKGLPIIMDVPAQNRGKHFFMTLVSTFFIAMLSGLILGPYLIPGAYS